MAREFAQIKLSIWENEGYLALPMVAQWLYQVLVESDELSYAGVAPLVPARYSGLARDITDEQVAQAFRDLEAARFIVADWRTMEVCVRSYLRHDGVMKQPNVIKAAARAWAQIYSAHIREVVREEAARAIKETYPEATPANVEAALGPLNPTADPTPNPSRRKSPEGLPQRVTPNPSGEGLPQRVTPTPLTPIDTQVSSHLGLGRGSGGRGASVETPDSPASSAGADAAHPTETAGPDAADAPAPDARPRPAKPDRRGRRLPDGWRPARTPGNLEVEAGHDPAWLDRELARFRDHWAAQAGAKGRKADWDATWRNWLRKADEYAPRPRGKPREGPDWDRLMAQAIAADTADAQALELGGGVA